MTKILISSKAPKRPVSTLIQVPENSYKGINRYKNPFWVENVLTPNELYRDDPRYRQLITAFCKRHKIHSPGKFFEVRITRQASQLQLKLSRAWWDHPAFMDRVFWMFQKPYTEPADPRTGKPPRQWFFLEPCECLRVIKTGQLAFGTDKPFKSLNVAIIVPCEACDMAWDETAAGISEHLHYRPEVIKPQEQLEKEAVRAEDSKKVLEKAEDINLSPKWQKAMKAFDDNVEAESIRRGAAEPKVNPKTA